MMMMMSPVLRVGLRSKVRALNVLLKCVLNVYEFERNSLFSISGVGNWRQ